MEEINVMLDEGAIMPTRAHAACCRAGFVHAGTFCTDECTRI